MPFKGYLPPPTEVRPLPQTHGPLSIVSAQRTFGYTGFTENIEAVSRRIKGRRLHRSRADVASASTPHLTPPLVPSISTIWQVQLKMEGQTLLVASAAGSLKFYTTTLTYEPPTIGM